MNKEILNHYKNVHKMWNGKKWKFVYTVLCDGEKSHIINKVLGDSDSYTVFRFDKDEKLRRFSLWENSYELEGKHYSYTREEEEQCYDELHKKPYKFRFDWSYPYLTEILRDENDVKIMETQWQIVDEEKETFEKFINLCETSDYVMVNGHLGTYIKDCDEIVFPRNGMCPPNIKVSEYDYRKFDGEEWILACNSGIGYYHRVRFLKFVK